MGRHAIFQLSPRGSRSPWRRGSEPPRTVRIGTSGLHYLKQQLCNFLGSRDHRVVPRRELMVVVNAFRLRRSWATQCLATDAVDVRPRNDHGRGSAEVDRLKERSVRMRHEFGYDPIDVFIPDQAKPFRTRRRNSPALALRPYLFFDLPPELWPSTVEKTLSASRDDGVQIYQSQESARNPVGHRCDYDPCIAVSHQNHVAQVLAFQHPDNVFDVGL